MTPKYVPHGLAALSAIWLLTGCCTSKKCQLEHIAKDWCMTIRASQVIPVYPLTEDIQPGDIFLVQVPIEQQQDVYDDKGFLPLDNLIARLNPVGYTNFYDHSFLAGAEKPLLPRDWIRPQSTNSHYWDPAPHVAFPSYSFSVRRGQGLNLAVPVQGVPVGLSLLNSDAADGSVTIKQARTMGLDTLSLWEQLQTWAQSNKVFLSRYGATPKETNYVRVITRVYATGQMDVNLRDASSKSGGLDVGAAKPVNLLFPELPKDQTNTAAAVAANYTNGWNTLQAMIAKATEAAGTSGFLPGGSMRLAAASSRTVALQEQFDPPVILGYLGFDCAIEDDGTLDPPIPTHAHLDRKSRLQHAKVQIFNTQLKDQIKMYNAIVDRYTNGAPSVQEKIRDLARDTKLSAYGEGETWLKGLADIVDGNDPAKTAHFQELEKLTDNLKK